MAAGQLSLTRRALLAGACAGPVLASSGPVAAAGEGAAEQGRAAVQAARRWGVALGRFRAADSAIAAASHSEDEALYDRLGERHDAAIQRLLRTPAPDLAALALKLDLLVAQQVWEMRRGELCLASIQDDAHRFARG